MPSILNSSPLLVIERDPNEDLGYVSWQESHATLILVFNVILFALVFFMLFYIWLSKKALKHHLEF